MVRAISVCVPMASPNSRPLNEATFVTRLRPAGCPVAPLVSCQHNRQLAGWNLPPLVNRALRAHSHFRGPLLKNMGGESEAAWHGVLDDLTACDARVHR